MAGSNTALETALLTMRIFFQLKAVHSLIHVYFITALLGIIHIRKKEYVAGRGGNPQNNTVGNQQASPCTSHIGLCAPVGPRGHPGATLRHSRNWHVLDPGSVFLEGLWNPRPGYCVFACFLLCRSAAVMEIPSQ